MGVGTFLHHMLDHPRFSILETIGAFMPGEVFPAFFEMEMFQRALIAGVLVTVVAGFYGTHLMLRNLALIGDGLAHVTFGGLAIGITVGAIYPMSYALVACVVSSVLIFELQSRGILSGDTSIAIFLTGALAFGLVVLRLFGQGITTTIEAYLFGSLVLIDGPSLDRITMTSLFASITMLLFHRPLLSVTIDSVAAKMQGIPVHFIQLWFSVTIGTIVVSMVQLIGALLVTALLVTQRPRPVGQPKLSWMLDLDASIGLSCLFVGLYLSAELNTGSGTMIAFVAASTFALVGSAKLVFSRIKPFAS